MRLGRLARLLLRGALLGAALFGMLAIAFEALGKFSGLTRSQFLVATLFFFAQLDFFRIEH